MSRTCVDCGSSWDGRATFCGRCGSLLDEGIGAHADRDGGARRRRPWVGALAVAVVVGGAVAAVPRLSIERTPPVDGEIGVPEEDDLNAAPASARTRDLAAPPPEITCTVDGTPVACVRWSRTVLPPEGFERGGGWFAPAGDAHLLAASSEGFAIHDAATGTRLWQDDGLADSHPLDVSDGGVLLDGPAGTTYRDLDDGTVVWETPSGSGFLGGVVVDDVAVLGEHTPDGDTVLRGRDLRDGAVVWEAELPGALHVVGELPGGQALLEGVDGRPRHVVLDAVTGEVVSQFEAPRGWVAGVVDGIALHVSEPTGGDPSGPNLAGDGGATLTAIRLDDATVVWTQALRSAQWPVSITAGTALAPSTDHVAALEVATGRVRWELDLRASVELGHHGSGAWWGPGPGSEDWATVAVTYDQVGETVRAHDLGTGEVVWDRIVDGPIQHVFATGEVVLVDQRDGFTLLEPATGDEILSVALDGGHLSNWDPLTVIHPPSGQAALLDVPGVTVP